MPADGGACSPKPARIRAVDDVSFDIARGETLGLVGESGCGKTTTGRLTLRLVEPTSGSISFDGVDVLALPPAALREMRRDMQIVFQDPLGALNPRMTVGELIVEPLVIHGVGDPVSREERLRELLGLVGLAPVPCRPVSPRILGRATPAHLHRQSAGAQSTLRRLR